MMNNRQELIRKTLLVAMELIYDFKMSAFDTKPDEYGEYHIPFNGDVGLYVQACRLRDECLHHLEGRATIEDSSKDKINLTNKIINNLSDSAKDAIAKFGGNFTFEKHLNPKK